tara:strand:- start:19631 stop:21412 length:1782 start_codon:yes stop_codon:yes gene_type:complete
MPISSPKKILFWLITIIFPFILLAIIEIGFRIGGYNSDAQNLFIELPGKSDFYATNPNFAARYFPSFIPQVAPSLFLKEKQENSFRVFVLGGSTTQGFPYNFYGSFSSRIEQKLIMETQGLKIEVINLGMTAVNSYVLRDLTTRIVEYDPDAVVIYAGHNEYYGSFGVATSQFGIGDSIWLKRSILYLKNFRLYQFIEHQFKKEEDRSENRTLMAKVVQQSSIPLNGDIYNNGVNQFKDNMTEVLAELNEEGITTYISTITSNLKDQAPLGENEEALQEFVEGEKLYSEGKFENAKKKFITAKELDDTRFRAPEKINEVIKDLSDTYNVELINTYEVSFDSSLSGIPDNSFFVDHLHPDWDGSQLIGELFFDRIIEKQLSKYYMPNSLSIRPVLNKFEEVYSSTGVSRLLVGYPFTKGLTSNEEYANFQKILNSSFKTSYIDSIAASAWRTQREVFLALTDVLNYEAYRKNEQGISEHYLSLAQWQIFNDDLLKKGINEATNNRNLDNNTALLLHLILNKEQKTDPYFANTLSAIYLLNQDLDRAGYWLKESEKVASETSELLYNYARYYVMKGDTTLARKYYNRYMELNKSK